MYDIDFYHDLPIKPTNRIFRVRINSWSSACQFSKSSQKIEYFSYIGQLHSSKRKQVMTIWMLMIFAFLGYFYHFYLTVPFSRQDSRWLTILTPNFKWPYILISRIWLRGATKTLSPPGGCPASETGQGKIFFDFFSIFVV